MTKKELMEALARKQKEEQEARNKLENTKSAAEESKARSETMLRQSEENLTRATSLRNISENALGHYKNKLNDAISRYNATIANIDTAMKCRSWCWNCIANCDSRIEAREREIMQYATLSRSCTDEKQRAMYQGNIQKCRAEIARLRAERQRYCQLYKKIEAKIVSLHQKSEKFKKNMEEAKIRVELGEARLQDAIKIEKDATEARDEAKRKHESNVELNNQKIREAEEGYAKAKQAVEECKTALNSAINQIDDYCRD